MTSSEPEMEQFPDELVRPDRHLPPELKDERIREVRDMSTHGHAAFQIVFDQHYLPYGYWNPKPDDWEMTYAQTEYHQPEGLIGWLRPDKECICIVVTKEVPDDIL